MAVKVYDYSIQENNINITLNNKPFLTIPASASVNDVMSDMTLTENSDDKAVFRQKTKR